MAVETQSHKYFKPTHPWLQPLSSTSKSNTVNGKTITINFSVTSDPLIKLLETGIPKAYILAIAFSWLSPSTTGNTPF